MGMGDFVVARSRWESLLPEQKQMTQKNNIPVAAAQPEARLSGHRHLAEAEYGQKTLIVTKGAKVGQKVAWTWAEHCVSGEWIRSFVGFQAKEAFSSSPLLEDGTISQSRLGSFRRAENVGVATIRSLREEENYSVAII